MLVRGFRGAAVRRTAGYAAAVTVLALAAAGCTVERSTPQTLGEQTQVGSPGHTDPITSQRANYLDIMLSNVYATGPLTEGALMSVISGFGGGYVTSTTQSGEMGTSTQKLTLNVVLGGGSVKNSMQGESDFDPSGIACFSYTTGYSGYMGTAMQLDCPASLTAAEAYSTARRQLATEAVAEKYGASLTAVPTSLASAEKALRLPAATLDVMKASDFATGSGIAALAAPQSSGSCIYVDFRHITSTAFVGSTATVESGIVAKAWVTPTEAPCAGAGALSAAAFLTMDRDEGD